MNLASVYEGDIVQVDGEVYCLVNEKLVSKGHRTRLRLRSLTGSWNPPTVTGVRVTAHWRKSKQGVTFRELRDATNHPTPAAS